MTVSDGAQTAEALSFFTITNGRISGLVEFWAEADEPHADRAHLAESIH